MTGLIINVRGACGSGKSTLVRAVVADRCLTPMITRWRRVPLGLRDDRLFVAGHYSRPTMGGIDSFQTLSEPYRLVGRWCRTHDVLFEGKCQERDDHLLLHVARAARRTVVVLLDISPETAVEGVRARATANGIQERNILGSHRKALRDAERLEAAGIEVLRLDRQSALAKVMEMIA